MWCKEDKHVLRNILRELLLGLLDLSPRCEISTLLIVCTWARNCTHASLPIIEVSGRTSRNTRGFVELVEVRSRVNKHVSEVHSRAPHNQVHCSQFTHGKSCSCKEFWETECFQGGEFGFVRTRKHEQQQAWRTHFYKINFFWTPQKKSRETMSICSSKQVE